MKALSEYLSVTDAMIMMRMWKIRPIPIRWSRVTPLGFPVNFRVNLTKTRSYMTIEMSIESVTKPPRLAGGMLKFPVILRSKVVPCLTNKVLIWAIIMLGTKVMNNTGNILNICFVSSTSVIVHRFHLWVAPDLSEALSKNLHHNSYMLFTKRMSF